MLSWIPKNTFECKSKPSNKNPPLKEKFIEWKGFIVAINDIDFVRGKTITEHCGTLGGKSVVESRSSPSIRITMKSTNEIYVPYKFEDEAIMLKDYEELKNKIMDS